MGFCFSLIDNVARFRRPGTQSINQLAIVSVGYKTNILTVRFGRHWQTKNTRKGPRLGLVFQMSQRKPQEFRRLS